MQIFVPRDSTFNEANGISEFSYSHGEFGGNVASTFFIFSFAAFAKVFVRLQFDARRLVPFFLLEC